MRSLAPVADGAAYVEVAASRGLVIIVALAKAKPNQAGAPITTWGYGVNRYGAAKSSSLGTDGAVQLSSATILPMLPYVTHQSTGCKQATRRSNHLVWRL